MPQIKVNDKIYYLTDFANEEELEDNLEKLSNDIFGPGKIFLRFKKRIGISTKTIPDGYLLDLSSKKPELYFVESELDTHDVVRHISVQLMNFYFSYNEDHTGLRNILSEQINNDQFKKKKCDEYVSSNDYSSFDKFIDEVTRNSTFKTIVVINEEPEKLSKLDRIVKFDVEVLCIRKYEASDGDQIFEYDTFQDNILTETSSENSKSMKLVDKSTFDTIVVPARKEGFDKVFIGEDRWYAIKFSEAMQKQIKYIAGYQVKPISKITHIAEIKDILPYEGNIESYEGKFVINFKASAKKLNNPIEYNPSGKIKPLYGPRFAKYSKLIDSKNFDDLWYEE